MRADIAGAIKFAGASCRHSRRWARPRAGLNATALLIGSVLFVGGPSFDHDPQPYDLSTGATGKPCKVTLSNYVATDGKVGIFNSDIPNVGLVTKALDLATCGTLWSIESPVGSFRAVCGLVSPGAIMFVGASCRHSRR